MKDRQDFLLVSMQLLRICLFVFLLSGCEKAGLDSTPVTMSEPNKFKARYIQKSVDQVYDIEVVPVRQVKSKTLSAPIKILRKSNSIEARDPVRLAAITPVITTPGEGQYKKPEVVPFVDTPHIGKPPQSILAGSPQLRDLNPASIGSFNSLHGLRSNQVFALHQDRQGNIWLGTYGGLIIEAIWVMSGIFLKTAGTGSGSIRVRA